MGTTPPNDSPHSGYPLAALFLLLSLAATLLAMWAPAVQAAVGGGEATAYLLAYTIFSTIIWGIVGGFVGLYHYRRGMGALVGSITGATVGVLIGPLSVTRVGGFPGLIVICLLGSAVLVVIGVVSRLTANRPQSPP